MPIRRVTCESICHVLVVVIAGKLFSTLNLFSGVSLTRGPGASLERSTFWRAPTAGVSRTFSTSARSAGTSTSVWLEDERLPKQPRGANFEGCAGGAAATGFDV